MQNRTSERLKALRLAKGVSMEDMAAELRLYGVNPSKSMISRWESGGDPSLQYARVLARYFNVTLGYIMGFDDEDLKELSRSSDDFKDLKRVLDVYKLSSGKSTLTGAPETLVHHLTEIALEDIEKYLGKGKK